MDAVHARFDSASSQQPAKDDRKPPAPIAALSARVLYLQRAAGNRATTQFLQRRGLWDSIASASRDAIVGSFLEALPPGGIARRFIIKYAYGNGAPWHMDREEMSECNASIDLWADDHPQFRQCLDALVASGQRSGHIEFTGAPRAMTVGTLGGFTAHYEGTASLTADGGWTFQGTMNWTDREDFEPHSIAAQNAPSGRGRSGEFLTWVGRNLLPGTPFAITSDAVYVHQTSGDPFLQWYGATPLHPPRAVPARTLNWLPNAEGTPAHFEGVGGQR